MGFPVAFFINNSFLHIKNTNKIVCILMQGRIADAILFLRTNVAILVNVTPNAHVYRNSTFFLENCIKNSRKRDYVFTRKMLPMEAIRYG